MTTSQRPRLPWPSLLLLFLLLALPANRHAGSNEMARFATAVRIVEDGTCELGPYATRTNDVAVFQGKNYTDKAPGVSLLLVPVYALVRFLSDNFDVARALSRIFSLAALALFSAVVLWRRLHEWEVPPRTALVATAGFLVATTAWPFFTMLYGHGFAACLILLGVLNLVSYRARPEQTKLLIWSVACFGFSIAIEYPTALLGAVAGIYLLSFERRIGRIAVFTALGVLLPAAIIGGFNWAAFGSPLHLGYTEVKSAYYDEQMSHGVMGVTWPRADNLWLLLLSPAKGLFFWSPFLLIGLAGLVAMIVRRRREGLLLTGMFLVLVLFFSGHFEASGGAGLGPRHLTPVVGLLVLAAAWLAGQTGARLRGALAGAAAFSSLLMSVGMFTEPQMPDRVVNPLWEFAVPMLAVGVGPGNALDLPDTMAWLLVVALLAALWLSTLLVAEPPDASPGRTWQTGLVVFGLLVAFYAGVAPWLGRTEPGMLHQVRANHFMVRENYRQAALEYEQAFETRKDPWILFYLARAYGMTGERERVDATVQRLLAIDPNFISRLKDNRPLSGGP